MRSEEAAIQAWETFPERCGAGGVTQIMEDIGPALYYQAQHDRAARRQLLDYMRQQLTNMPNMAMIVGINLSDLDLAFDAIAHGREADQFINGPTWWEDQKTSVQFRRDPRFAELVEQMDYVDYWREFGWPDGMCTPLGDSFVCDN